MKEIQQKIIIALDYADLNSAYALIDTLPTDYKLKVGKEMFTRFGPSFVEELVKRGFKVFLDLKFHDIPRTVAKACHAAADLGVWMVNVHALGGRRMLEAAREALQGTDKPYLVAVTLLTSLDKMDLADIGFSGELNDRIVQLAKLANECSLDGVVCSAQETSLLRSLFPKSFYLVTPGIRLADDKAGDQKRIMTPKQAVTQGADYLVIGHSITCAEDPELALQKIVLAIHQC